MAKTIEQIIGYVQLCGTIKAVTSGVPKPLPDAFYNTIKGTLADYGRYTQITGTRQTARRVEYGAPSLRRQLRDIASRDVKLLHYKQNIMMDMVTLQKLRNYNDYSAQQMGIDEVDRQTQEFKRLFENTRATAVLQTLANGILYHDSDGNLLPSSSGSATSVDYGVPSGNKNQLDVFGGGAIIGASWATASTDIPNDIRQIRQAALKKTGYPIKYAIYGVNVPSYFAKNDYVLSYLSRNPPMNAQYLSSAELPAGLFGLTWIPAYEGFYEDYTNTNNTIVADDAIIFTPEPSADWWEVMEGTYPVPTTINLANDAIGAHGTFQQIQGMFQYAVPSHDPPTFQFIAGDTFLPILKVPGAIFQADVVP